MAGFDKHISFKEAAEAIDLGPRRLAAHDKYKNEKPSTWTCSEHKVSGIKEGDECPKCKKERERVERKQAEEAGRERKRA